MMGRRGTAATEFALTLPLGLTILAAAIDGGMYMVETSVASRAARDGARVGSMTLESVPVTGDVIEGAAKDAAQASLNAAGVGADAVVTASWFQDDAKVSWIEVKVELEHISFFGDMTPFGSTIRHSFYMVTQEQL